MSGVHFLASRTTLNILAHIVTQVWPISFRLFRQGHVNANANFFWIKISGSDSLGGSVIWHDLKSASILSNFFGTSYVLFLWTFICCNKSKIQSFFVPMSIVYQTRIRKIRWVHLKFWHSSPWNYLMPFVALFRLEVFLFFITTLNKFIYGWVIPSKLISNAFSSYNQLVLHCFIFL